MANANLQFQCREECVFFWPFSGFIDSADEEFDRKQGKRQGVTRSKGTWAGSRTRVHCRASAHGSRALPTELCGAPGVCPLCSKAESKGEEVRVDGV